jgi:signal transduction histidine kinase
MQAHADPSFMETPPRAREIPSSSAQTSVEDLPDSRLERNVEAAVTRERKRFARELHDVIASNLQAAMLYLEQARQRIPSDDPVTTESLDAAIQQLMDCWADARRCAAAIRPAALDKGGLSASLAEYVGRLSSAVRDVRISFEACTTLKPLPRGVELDLLRIAEEAVTNALRHSAAERISVELFSDGQSVRLEVDDDGVGFDPSPSGGGSGLANIRQRADELGASLSIISAPGCGTQLILTLVLERDSSEENLPPPSEIFVG